jgi:hypothetical protein
MIQTNTTLNLGGSTLFVGGDWVCNGTLNISVGGLVVLNGTGPQSVGACALDEFDINKPSGTATLAGNISVNGDAEVISGTLDLSAFTIGYTVAGASISVAAGATLRTAGSFPTNFTLITLDPASTVEYYGSGSQTVSAATYGNLIVTNGGSNPKTLAGPVTVAGNLLIGSTATLAASANSLTLLGNWTNSGAFTAGTGTVVLNGTNKTVAGATTFNNLTVPGSYTVTNCDLTVSGNATVLGSFGGGSGTFTVDGNFLNSGNLSSSGTITITGTRLQTLQMINGIQSVSSGTVNFNGTVSPLLYSTTPPVLANVNINNTGGVIAGAGWTVYGRFKVGSGASFDGSVFTHTFYGTVTNNGTMTSGGTFNFSPASATTLTLGSSFSSAGIVVFSGTNQITISSGALSLGSVEVANTHAAGITPVSNWTLAGNLQMDSGTVFHAGSGLTYTIAGDVNNNGTLDGGASLVTFNGTSEIHGTGSTVFNNLLVSGSLTNFADIWVAGNFTNNGAFDASGVNLNFTGSSPSSLAGTTTPTTIDSLVIAKSSATVTLGVNVGDLTGLTLSGGTLDTTTFSLSENTTDFGALTVSAGATFKLGGNNTFPTFTGGVNLNPASTVNFSGAAQTIQALPYANLILSGSGNKTLATTNTINGNLDISGTAKLNLTYASGSPSAVGSLTFSGALQAAGTWGSTSSSADNKTNTYFQGTGKLNVGNRSLDHFAVITPGAQTAGTSFNITTITAQDANNNAVTSFIGKVDLTETGDGAGGTVSPSLSSTFVAGMLSSQSMALTKAGAGATITVSDHAGTLRSGVSGAFTVNPSAINHYAVTFSAPPFNAGVPFNTIVTAQDTNNNTVTADSSTWVIVSSTSTNMGWDATGIGEFNNGLTSGQGYFITKPLTNGVASFSTRHNVAETNLTTTASSTGPTLTGTSAAIDIQTMTGAYPSKTSGNWGDTNTWEKFDGSAWLAAVAAPSSSDGVITIQSPHTVSVAADVTLDQLFVQSGGQLTVSNGVTLTIGSTSSPGFEVNGTLHNGGTLTLNGGSHSLVRTGGVLENSGTINSTFSTLDFQPGSPGGKYRHLFTTTAGTIPTAQWEAGSVCEITGYSTNTGTPGGLGQGFYDFTWNCPSQAADINLGTNLTAVGNNFNVTNTGSGTLTLGGNLTVTNTATVSGEAQLNCVTYVITGAAFTLGSGGTLGIGSPDGITSSGASGNIQTTTRTFSTDDNYVYNGTAAQSQGSGLPATVNNLTIANSAGASFFGTITVNGTCAVNSNSLFNASGTINGPVTVNGTLAPGNSVGTLNTGAESWNSGGTYKFEINDAAGTAGTDPGWNLLNSSGTLTVNATSGSKFTLKVVSLSGSSAGNATNFDNTQNYTWLIATASSLSGFDASEFTIDTSGFSNGKGSGGFVVSQSGNNVYLQFVHVTAGPVTVGRAWGTFVRIPVDTVLTNASGGTPPRTLQSVTSRDGDYVQISGSYILFAPAGNASRILDYTVADSASTPLTASSTITVNVTNAVSTVNSVSSTGGGVTMTLAGLPAYNYVVERSSSASIWTSATTVQTIQAPAGGVWTFTDASPPNPSFYRLRQGN